MNHNGIYINYQQDINAIDFLDLGRKIYSFTIVGGYFDEKDKDNLLLYIEELLTPYLTIINGKIQDLKYRKNICSDYKKINNFCRSIYDFNMSVNDVIKSLKYNAEKINPDINNPVNNHTILTLIKLMELMNKIKDKRILNILIPSIFRFHEFFYYNHKELEKAKSNLINNLYINQNDNINMRDTKESVYKDYSLFDSYNHFQNLDNFSTDIDNYLKDQGIDDTVTKSEYILSLENIKQDIIDLSNENITKDTDPKLPCRELFPFLILYQHRYEFCKYILDYVHDGKLSKDSIKTKDSGSIYNENKPFKSYFADRYGINSISNIEANWIVGESSIVDVNKLRKNNMISEFIPGYNMDVVRIDYGLGDCFKLRVVGETATMHQAALAPLTKLYKRLVGEAIDSENGVYKSSCIATYDIEGRMKILKSCKHAISFDYTGYSDYLSRAYLYMIFNYICGWDPEAVKVMIDIFSLPIRQNNKLFKILFGTLQGVEFDFTAITLANLSFSLHSRYIYYLRHKDFLNDINTLCQGDDKIIVSFINKIPEEFKNLNMSLAIMANCVINKDKTEDSEETNTYTFCKIRYSLDKEPLSGLSGNMMLKQIKFCSDISAILMQCDKVGYGLSNYEKEIISNFLLDKSKNIIKRTYKLISHLNEEESEKVIEMSKTIPYVAGGLMIKDTNSIEYLKVCRNALVNLHNNTFAKNIRKFGRITRFALLSKLIELDDVSHTIYNDVRFSQLVSSTYSKGEDVLRLISLSEELLNSELIDINKFKELKEEMRKVFNLFYKELSNSNAISTKDRVDPVTNQDLIIYSTLSDDEDINERISDLLTSEDRILKEVRIMIENDTNFDTEIDLIAYENLSQILIKYNAEIMIEPYRGGYLFDNTYYRINFLTGKFSGMKLRLNDLTDQTKDSYRGYSFLIPEDFDNPNEYWFIKKFFESKFKSGDLDKYIRRSKFKKQKKDKMIKELVLKKYLS